MKSKKLSLKKEALSLLAADDLRVVAGAFALTMADGTCNIRIPDVSDCSCACSIGAECCNTYTCPPGTELFDLLTGRVCNY